MNPYVGHDTQLSGCYRFIYDDGALKGTQAVEVYNETGLRFTVLLGRGMDIAYASYKGVPFAYVGKSGFTSAAYFQNGGTEWGRAFGGGLVTTCGLNNVGPGFEDGREIFGDHGRFTSITAEQVAVRRIEDAEEPYMEVSGVLRQAAIFGESFYVTRTIRCYLHRNCIELRDVIENRAFEAQPLMVMYHCNFGYPLLSEHAQLQLHAAETKPRDVAASGDFTQIQPPASGFAEQVFYHKGADCAVIRNAGFGVRLSWDAGALPCLTQWNMFGAGDYVMGLKPGNCHPVGRQAYLASPNAEYLQPGQKKMNTLCFEIVIYSTF